MNTNVLCAVFKRNFVNYFANPTGYVFICVFLLLSSCAAFRPSEFFSANLCNLDALNGAITLILLFFVPAITMGVWADENRQGTDELLLTIPAGDLEIVLGKYLACVAIYTVALVFSGVSNYLFLWWLGGPDKGLFLSNYLGYWFLGLAMLSIGMVASFLTRNLTVAYILGAVLNGLVVLTWYADMIPTVPYAWAMVAKHWSLGGQFQEFGRGIIGLSGVVYFLMIAAIMLYLCMVLIGRRHWIRSGLWLVLGSHFILRAVAMGAMAVGAVYFLYNHPLRLDATSEHLSTLSPRTDEVIDGLRKAYQTAEVKRPVRIEAFVSTKVPETYLQTRLNLLSTLRELKARAGDMMEVQINDTERTGAMAELAKQRYGIAPKRVLNIVHGSYNPDQIFLSVAVTCGLERVVLPFIDRGTPVEYELVRAICTVERQKRKRVGVVESDAPLFGRFSMQGQSPAWQLITDLKKQYEVIQVNPAQPIPLRKPASKPGEKEEGFDVLLAVQPSAMGPPECENLIAAIRAGQPTVLFEDPFPYFAPEIPGTSQPRRPPDQMQAMFMPQQNVQKGNLKPLWEMLGIAFSGSENGDDFQPIPGDEEGLGAADQIVFQNYNPYPKQPFPPEFVFLDNACGGKGFDPFNEKDPISSGLQHLLFPAPGYIEKRNSSKLRDYDFEPLMRTSTNSGTLRTSQMILRTMLGSDLNPDRPHKLGPNTEYILAAHITGRLPAAVAPDPKQDPKARPEKAPDAKVNVVLVADIDMLTDAFFELREQGEVPGTGMTFDFDNTTFVLNAIDALAGEDRFLELRKRRPRHRTLTRVDERLEESRKEESAAHEKFRKDKDDNIKKESDKLNEEMKNLEERLKKDPTIEQADIARRKQTALLDGQRRVKARKEELEENYVQQTDEISNKLEAKIQNLRGWYMLCAVLLPPVAPLLLAGFVFVARRAREREGVSKTRLR
jgi:ABC-2 type transport system permease protein